MGHAAKAEGAANGGGGYIDIHTHLFTPGAEPAEKEVTTAIRLAKRYGIERIVLLGNITAMGGPDPSPEVVTAVNTHTMAVVSRYPDIYLGFCYLNPSHPVQFIKAEIERCVVRGGMHGLKLWVAVKATDERLDPIMAQAQALQVPVLHHAWYKQTSYVYNESTPAEVAALARRWPGVTIIMAHLAGGGARGVLDIADAPNVLVDTSGSQPEAGLVEYAVQHLGPERVIYGSDWPIRDFGTQVGRVAGASLSPAEKRLILAGNAARILGLAERST